MTDSDLSTRATAARTLDRVLRQGAYSNVLVSTLETADRNEHGLYQRLVYEALRYLPAIDEAIERASTRKIDRVQPLVLSVLRIATAEVRHLKRPVHSAVSLAVDAVRQLGKPGAAGFVNGVLRSVVRDADQPVSSDAYHGMPPWLHERLGSVFGDDRDAFVAASNLPAATGIRTRGGPQLGRDSGVAGSSYVTHDDALASLVTDGTIDIIDPASVAVVNALAVEPGDTVADLAAAPGGKTRAIADAAGAEALVVACDVHARRLMTARNRSLDLGQIRWILADASAPPLRGMRFDKVLLDAPCTGLGTLRRRPEIKYRIDDEAPMRLGMKQRTMLEAALALVRPGGRLVYSVCTVFPEETSEVVAGFGGREPSDSMGIAWGDGTLLAPHVNGTDAMFISVFDR